MKRLNWAQLLSTARLPKSSGSAAASSVKKLDWLVDSRTETERDFDRVLFATPIRRLADKTQVFPLEKNDSVRTRLTHSHEVANLARSLGVYLAHSSLGATISSEAAGQGFAEGRDVALRALPAMLATVALAHDLGNPPFGHEGEEAIRRWARHRSDHLFKVTGTENTSLLKGLEPDLGALTQRHRSDFLHFEGNAQTLRTVAKLQVVKDDRGLNLTFGTLAALMKYTVASDQVHDGDIAAKKKFGFFASERGLVDEIQRATGLSDEARHPLTFLMEACDDIAYSVVDAEDAVKKQIVSFSDIIAWLRGQKDFKSDELSVWIVETTELATKEAGRAGLTPAEYNDVCVQLFRTHAINGMMSAAIVAFEEHYEGIMDGTFQGELLKASKAKSFVKWMKQFDKAHAYLHRRVLAIELDGYNVLSELMDMLWRGITDRECFHELGSPRVDPFSRYAYSRFSENYRRVFEGKLNSSAAPSDLPIRYRELQLLSDMVAGMTDSFAIELHSELKRLNVGPSAAIR